MSDISIVVGTSSGHLVGFRATAVPEDPTRQNLEHSFTLEQVHAGSVRALARHGTLLASGGTDGRVVLTRLGSTERVGMVTVPKAEVVTGMDFAVHGECLFVAGWEGSMTYIGVERKRVACRKREAHRTPVQAVKVCPEGGRLVSVGRDRIARVWDLETGLTQTKTWYRSEGRFSGAIWAVGFNSSGDLLATAGDDYAEVRRFGEGEGVVRSIAFRGRPVGAVWISQTVLAVGLDQGSVVLSEETGHYTVQLYNGENLKALDCWNNLLATISNEGNLSIWTISNQTVQRLSNIATGYRPTTLLLHPYPHPSDPCPLPSGLSSESLTETSFHEHLEQHVAGKPYADVDTLATITPESNPERHPRQARPTGSTTLPDEILAFGETSDMESLRISESTVTVAEHCEPEEHFQMRPCREILLSEEEEKEGFPNNDVAMPEEQVEDLDVDAESLSSSVEFVGEEQLDTDSEPDESDGLVEIIEIDSEADEGV